MSKQGYIQRYLLIIRLIRNNRYISLPELIRKVEDGLAYYEDTEDVGISRRTILRDLKEIRSGLGWQQAGHTCLFNCRANSCV